VSFTTTATLAHGNNVVATCPHCGVLVMVRLCGVAYGGKYHSGAGRCRGCHRTLQAAVVRIPLAAWQDGMTGASNEARQRKISALHGCASLIQSAPGN
jgi:hypothetical protein